MREGDTGVCSKVSCLAMIPLARNLVQHPAPTNWHFETNQETPRLEGNWNSTKWSRETSSGSDQLEGPHRNAQVRSYMDVNRLADAKSRLIYFWLVEIELTRRFAMILSQQLLTVLWIWGYHVVAIEIDTNFCICCFWKSIESIEACSSGCFCLFIFYLLRFLVRGYLILDRRFYRCFRLGSHRLPEFHTENDVG